MTTKAERKQQWMAAYELTLVALVPRLAGKVDWDAATFFYNQGHPANLAAHAAARNASRFNEDIEGLKT